VMMDTAGCSDVVLCQTQQLMQPFESVRLGYMTWVGVAYFAAFRHCSCFSSCFSVPIAYGFDSCYFKLVTLSSKEVPVLSGVRKR